MKITKRQLKRIIREATDDYYAAVQSPEAQEALVAAGFLRNGLSADYSQGLGPAELGMYTPQNMEDVMGWIEAAIAINEALRGAVRDLEDGIYRFANEAYWKVVLPVQRTFSKYGASDTEGRETTGTWLENQGFDWEY